MCGRFALGLPHGDIIQAVRDAHPELDLGDWVDEYQFHPRFNVAPRSQSPVVRRRNRFDDREEAGKNQNQDQETPRPGENKRAIMQTMKWGVVPHWNKHEDKSLNTINARAEHLVDKGGMWASIKGKKRCAVLCQGYYEWLKKGKDRLPHFTKHKDGQLMFLAGMYDSVVLEGETERLWTFTIVTTEANKEFSWLHERMPVILSTKTELEQWLDCSSQSWTAGLSKIVLPYNNRKRPLDCYAVPTDVGKVGSESSTFIEPIAQRKDGIQAMFAKQAASSSQKTKSPPSPSPGTKKPESSAKRKRSSSPTLKRELSIEILDGPPQEKKPRKIAIPSDVDVIHRSTNTDKRMTAEPPASPSKPKSRDSKISRKSPTRTTMSSSPSSSKITSFFSKEK